MLKFEAGSLSPDELRHEIGHSDDVYLRAFLKRAGMNPEKIPKGSKPMRDRCVKWASEEDTDRRPFVLLTTEELKARYRSLKGSALDQELMNIVIRGMALKPLKGRNGDKSGDGDGNDAPLIDL